MGRLAESLEISATKGWSCSFAGGFAVDMSEDGRPFVVEKCEATAAGWPM